MFSNESLEIVPNSSPNSVANFEEPTQVPRIKTSLPPIRTLAVMNEAGHLSDKVKEVIEVVHLIKHSVKLKSRDGGEIDAMRTIFICKDGSAWATVSGPIADGLPLLVAMFGNPPYSPPLRLQVLSKRTTNGFNMLLVLPVEPVEAE